MWPNPQFPADLVTFTEEILNGKLHFLCSVLPIIPQLFCPLFLNLWHSPILLFLIDAMLWLSTPSLYVLPCLALLIGFAPVHNLIMKQRFYSLNMLIVLRHVVSQNGQKQIPITMNKLFYISVGSYTEWGQFQRAVWFF